ncbi:SDR family oxidoreductase [Herbiconiux sp. CPCC 203407]|uniref:SDR family oxidoreductase n=1 Tax=Herbiconiux oxytropis TaxID=2970915 RepID=A0AA42BWT7_9MICO|nr:SDR family NAD(P)-dependent oxidoreductase [Herbiconiux oxytropis]MCS5722244.1 SDR family oxidoreductase [Herbiconiux oxytropis]MCS5727118.1 SDR family oxidoreductase [Herbiconiux oxytropis]
MPNHEETTPATTTVRVGAVDVETWGARRFPGRIAVVTGAASGIGRAVVERLVAEGATVYALDLSAGALDAVWAGVDGVVTQAVDVGDSAQVNAAFERVSADHGRLDVLVTAAGISDAPWRLSDRNSDPDPSTIDDAAWDLVIRVNLTGTFYCVRAALPLLRKNEGRGGAVVTISSVGALAPYPLAAAYPASKAGVLGMTRAIAALVGSENIRINAVAPAATKTAMLPDDEELLASMVALQPIARVVPASEMAATIVYLCSDEAQFITGQTVNSNGGMVM